HRLLGQGPQLAAWRLAADHPAQVALQHLNPAALAPPREVGEKPEGTLCPRFGQAADNRPAEAVAGVGQPVLQPRHRYLPGSAGGRPGTATPSAGAPEHLSGCDPEPTATVSCACWQPGLPATVPPVAYSTEYRSPHRPQRPRQPPAVSDRHR